MVPSQPSSHRIGTWRLVDQIAEDRLGAIYSATGLGGREARVRQVPARLVGTPGALDILLAVSRRLGRPGVPGLAPVVDIVQASHDWYLLTEHVRSIRLAALLDGSGPGGGLDSEAVHAVLLDVGEACLQLHSWGLAHGALSVDTIEVGEDGTARALDPALVALAQHTQLTEAGDTGAWAEVARALRLAWVDPDDPYRAALDQAIALAAPVDGGADLHRALDALNRSRGNRAHGWEERAGLRDAVQATLGGLPARRRRNRGVFTPAHDPRAEPATGNLRSPGPGPRRSGQVRTGRLPAMPVWKPRKTGVAGYLLFLVLVAMVVAVVVVAAHAATSAR